MFLKINLKRSRYFLCRLKFVRSDDYSQTYSSTHSFSLLLCRFTYCLFFIRIHHIPTCPTSAGPSFPLQKHVFQTAEVLPVEPLSEEAAGSRRRDVHI